MAGDSDALRLLRANAAVELPVDVAAEAVEAEAFGAWALVHGLAMLMLDGQGPVDERMVERLVPLR